MKERHSPTLGVPGFCSLCGEARCTCAACLAKLVHRDRCSGCDDLSDLVDWQARALLAEKNHAAAIEELGRVTVAANARTAERDAARAEVKRLTATIDGSKTFAAWAAMEREVERLTKERDEAAARLDHGGDHASLDGVIERLTLCAEGPLLSGWTDGATAVGRDDLRKAVAWLASSRSEASALAAQLAEVMEAAKDAVAGAVSAAFSIGYGIKPEGYDEVRAVVLPDLVAKFTTALSASPSAALASVRAAVLEEVAQRFDKLHGCDAPGSRESFGAAFVRSIAEAERIEREAGR